MLDFVLVVNDNGELKVICPDQLTPVEDKALQDFVMAVLDRLAAVIQAH